MVFGWSLPPIPIRDLKLGPINISHVMNMQKAPRFLGAFFVFPLDRQASMRYVKIGNLGERENYADVIERSERISGKV